MCHVFCLHTQGKKRYTGFNDRSGTIVAKFSIARFLGIALSLQAQISLLSDHHARLLLQMNPRLQPRNDPTNVFPPHAVCRRQREGNKSTTRPTVDSLTHLGIVLDYPHQRTGHRYPRERLSRVIMPRQHPQCPRARPSCLGIRRP